METRFYGSRRMTVILRQHGYEVNRKQVQRLMHCSKEGQNYARNFGLTHARGDYIQWLNADDELEPDKVAWQVAALESQLDILLMGSGTGVFG